MRRANELVSRQEYRRAADRLPIPIRENLCPFSNDILDSVNSQFKKVETRG